MGREEHGALAAQLRQLSVQERGAGCVAVAVTSGPSFLAFGLFLTLLFLFLRFLPVISIAEMRELVSETRGEAAAGGER